METSRNEDEILGKRKRSIDFEEQKFKLIKPMEGVGSSVQDKGISKTGEKDEGHSEPGPENKPESARENSKEQSNSEEYFIDLLLRDAMKILLMKIEVEDAAVKKSYHEIKDTFKVHDFTKLDFNNSDNLIAYFSTYSIFNTKLIYHRFRDIFENCKELQEKVKKQNLNIISLGGGPGTDILAFCSALQGFLTQEVKNYCTSINISVTDVWKRWASIYNVIGFLIREGNYGNVSTLFKNNVECSSFLVVDLLSEEQPWKYRYDLQTADIVLLVRVLDIFKFEEARPKDLIKKVISRMKSGALLLVIDSVTTGYFSDEVTQVYTSKLKEFETPLIQQAHFTLHTKKFSKAQSFILQKK